MFRNRGPQRICPSTPGLEVMADVGTRSAAASVVGVNLERVVWLGARKMVGRVDWRRVGRRVGREEKDLR